MQLIVVLFLAVAAFLLYLPPELCGALAITPDSTEYSVCLANFFEKGTFGFTINGQMYPSRYAPWFSLTCLSPGYLLTGTPLGCSLMILVFALVLLYAVWRWGQVCGLGKWAIAPLCVLMLSPTFVYYSRVVMTEIPYATLTTVLGLVFVRFTQKETCSARFCGVVGLLVAWCGAVRSSGLLLLAPFVVVAWLRKTSSRRFLVDALALSVPSGAYLLLAAGYNYHVFGDFFRAGYSYWQSIPFDFPDLLFNWRYFSNVLAALSSCPMFSLMVGGVLLVLTAVAYDVGKKFWRSNCSCHEWLPIRAGESPFHVLACFFLWHTGVIFALYCRYFFFDLRFFLPMYVGVVPLVMAAVIRYVTRSATLRFLVLIIMIAVFNFAFHTKDHQLKSYFDVMKRMQYDAVVSGTIAKQIPDAAVLIPNLNPCIAEYFGLGEKHITMIPFDHTGEYGNRMIASSSIGEVELDPAGELVGQTIEPQLVKSGRCHCPFRQTVSENPDVIKQLVDSRRRVFVLPNLLERSNGEALESILRHHSLELRHIGTWEIDQIDFNPVRHFYDLMLFATNEAFDHYLNFPLVICEVVPMPPSGCDSRAGDAVSEVEK